MVLTSIKADMGITVTQAHDSVAGFVCYCDLVTRLAFALEGSSCINAVVAALRGTRRLRRVQAFVFISLAQTSLETSLVTVTGVPGVPWCCINVDFTL